MKTLLPLLFLLTSCETLRQPALDASGQPVLIQDQPITATLPNGDTVILQPSSSEPRPSTIGDSLAGAGAQAVGVATGLPWLAPILAGVAGIFLRRKKQPA